MVKNIKKRKSVNIIDESVLSKRNIIYLSIILIISFLAFSPALDNEFVKWDDDWYIQENPQMNNFSFSKIENIFTTFYKGQYSPVSTLILSLS